MFLLSLSDMKEGGVIMAECFYSFLQKPILLKVESFLPKAVPVVKFLTSDKVLANAVLDEQDEVCIGVYVSIEEVAMPSKKKYYTIISAHMTNNLDGNVWWEFNLPLSNYIHIDYETNTSSQGHNLPQGHAYNLQIRLLNSSYDTEGSVAPSITFVSKTPTSITFTLTNNCAGDAFIYYEINDETPDLANRFLRAGQTSADITIDTLAAGNSYDLYAMTIYNGQESVVANYSFSTQIGTQVATPSISLIYFDGISNTVWRIINNDSETAVIYTEINDTTPDYISRTLLPGEGAYVSSYTYYSAPRTIYAIATIAGRLDSALASQAY